MDATEVTTKIDQLFDRIMSAPAADGDHRWHVECQVIAMWAVRYLPEQSEQLEILETLDMMATRRKFHAIIRPRRATR